MPLLRHFAHLQKCISQTSGKPYLCGWKAMLTGD